MVSTNRANETEQQASKAQGTAVSSAVAARQQEDTPVLDSAASASKLSNRSTEERTPPSTTIPVNHTQRDAHSPVSGGAADAATANLPPSPLVTPPGGKSVDRLEPQLPLYPALPAHVKPRSVSSPTDSPKSHSSTNQPRTTTSKRPCSPAGQNPSPTGSPGSAKARGVPHIYHDYSQVPDVVGYVRKKTGGVTQPFPEKLHEMLNAVEQDPQARTVVSWLPHGRAFLVHKPKDFTREIMPKFFRQTKLTSFQRQLNLYGFRRITQGPDSGAYYHEMFLRGRPGLCQRMVRQKVKGTGHKQPADASSEPNFYDMPSLMSSTTPQISVLAPSKTSASLLDATPSTPQPYPTHGFVLDDASSTPISPGTQSVRGAAHLLHGIASGGMSFDIQQPFLGQAAANQDERLQQPQGSSQGRAASFLPEMTGQQESV